jgi:hypothetical protein
LDRKRLPPRLARISAPIRRPRILGKTALRFSVKPGKVPKLAIPKMKVPKPRLNLTLRGARDSAYKAPNLSRKRRRG